VIGVVLAALALHHLFPLSAGRPFFDASASLAALRALHPLGSGTLVWAAVTVALFFLSSLGAGRLRGSLRLGVLLGMAPVIGRFFGLPFEVRHVTFSAGLVTLAFAGSGLPLSDARLWWAVSGVLSILALDLAIRAGAAVATRRPPGRS
jgi:site-specific recombinase